MKLARLIYSSSLKPHVDHTEIKKIHEVAEEQNRKLRVTGMLIFGNENFLQAIEGDRDVINSLYDKIFHDPRHHQLIIRSYQEINDRKFNRFAMKLILLTQANAQFVLQFSTSELFNPSEMTSESALKMMLALRD